MSKFKTSKFRNTQAKAAKKELSYIGLSVPNLNSSSDHVAASGSFFACNATTGTGGSLSVIRLDDYTKKDASMPLLNAHSGFVSDFQFSPFDDNLLSTGSDDCTVKFWRIPDGGLSESLSTPLVSISLERKLEALRWHPAAHNVLATASSNAVKIWDVESGKERFAQSGHGDSVTSVSWRETGQVLVSACKDKKLRILDPRSSSVVAECSGHGGVKEPRVLWLGDEDYVVSTGFSASRERELCLRDIRNFDTVVQRSSLGSSTGIVLPFYDADTGILLLVGKGDCTVNFLEFDSKKSKLSDGNGYSSALPQKGACLVPKRALNIDQCEVARLLQLQQNAVQPIGYYVPRKSYMDFADDLYPETLGTKAAMTADEWCDGANDKVERVSLQPENKTSASAAASRSANAKSSSGTRTDSDEVEIIQLKAFTGVRSSKVRHWQGITQPKSTWIDGLKPVCTSIPGDSDGLSVSHKRALVPLAGVGGHLTVVQLDKPCRLKTTETTSIPYLETGCAIQDFCFDPFDDSRVYIAGEDGKVNIFKVPAGGLTSTIVQPEASLRGHYEKVNILLPHPTAAGVLATASFDLSVKIWDIPNESEKIVLEGHTEQVFGMAWSSDGNLLATMCKDRKLRIYDPRSSTSPIETGCGPSGSRGGRIAWVGTTHLIVSGFDKTSQRLISLYDRKDMSKPINTIRMDVSPSILVIRYDEDRQMLYYHGKGDSTLCALEVSLTESPFLFSTTFFKGNGLQQAISFQPFNLCSVKDVEIASVLRLSSTGSLEPVKLKIPRTRSEFFQDDLFPPAKVTWESSLSGADWFSGKNVAPKTINLQPAGMTPLSEAPVIVATRKKYESFNPKEKTDEEKKEELLTAMVSKMTEPDEPLPQDEMEGVEDEEWD